MLPCRTSATMQDQFKHNELRAFSGEAILSMWLNASCIHSSQFHLPKFFWYLLASTCKLLFTMISFNPWHHLSFSIGWKFMLQQDCLYRPSLLLIRAVPCLRFYDAWIFSPLQTNGGYCSMHLNNDIVDVLNTSIASILPTLTQQLLMRWTP
jgi:hypothetical protein